MTSLNSLSGNEFKNSDADLDLPVDQQAAQGDSTQSRAPVSQTASQQLSPVHSEQPSNAEVAHAVAAVTSSDGSLEVTGSSGEMAEQAIPLSSGPVQQNAQDSGGAYLQRMHIYPPMSKAQSHHFGSSSLASAGNLNPGGNLRPLPFASKPAVNPGTGTATPLSQPAFPSELAGENKSQSGSTLQESPTHRQPVSQNASQIGGQNSGALKPGSSQISSSLASGRLEPLRRVPTHLEPLRRIPMRVEELPETEEGGRSGAASFNLLSGKTLGEVSNVLSEAGTLAGSTKTGIAGESLFGVGGLWQAGTAGVEFSNLLSSDSSPQQQKQLLSAGIDLMKGVLNTTSGVTGVIGGATGSAGANKASSVTWALSEGANALTQAYEAVSAGKALTPEQMVRLGQVVGSTLKFGGTVASLAGVTGNAPSIAQVAGTAVSMGSGVMNLNNKDYDLGSTVKQYTDTIAGMLSTRRGQNNPEPTPGEFNPDAHQMV